MQAQKTMISWSSGKDSAWMLYQLEQNPEIEICGLFTTINKKFQRVAMHGVRLQLLKLQAESLAYPLHIIELPDQCSNQQYQQIMQQFVNDTEKQGIQNFAFGDLFLEDIRDYRIQQLKETKIKPLFPLWGSNTKQLSKKIIDAGFEAIISCVDSSQINRSLIGSSYSDEFLDALPASADPCGENGEFHSFVYNAPNMKKPIKIVTGEIIDRRGFIFIDIQ